MLAGCLNCPLITKIEKEGKSRMFTSLVICKLLLLVLSLVLLQIFGVAKSIFSNYH